MAKVVVEVKNENWRKEYCSETLYQLACGMQRYLNENRRPEIDFFGSAAFKLYRDSLDAQMKLLTSLGVGVSTKKAEPFSEDDEEMLWSKVLLGDTSPKCLLNMMVFLFEKYFSLIGAAKSTEVLNSTS